MAKETKKNSPVGAHEEQVAKLFAQHLYFEIPRFQRSYSWEVDEYTDFWEDIRRTSLPDSKHPHILGAMVFAPAPSTVSLYVLDGQQRLTTLMLLIAAMQHKMGPVQSKEDKYLDEDLTTALRVTVTVDDASERVERLIPNKQDRECFKELIDTGKASSATHESHSLMVKAYDFFSTQVLALSADGSERNKRIRKLFNAARDRFWFINIICEEDINPQVVFESLNAKGADLSAADLVKNYLFMEIDGEYGEKAVDEAELQWNAMLAVLGKDSHLPDYVHAYWGSHYSFSRMDELYSDLKERVSAAKENVRQFVKELAAEAETYSEIRDPSDGFWQSKPSARMLKELKELNIRVTNAIILALWSTCKTDPKSFEAYLRRLLNFMVRYSKVCEQPSNTIDKAFSELARGLRGGTVSLADFDEWLRSHSPSSGMFIESFKNWKIKSGPTARLILRKLNNALNPGGEPEAMIADTEKVTLEHIIPQEPNDIWQAFLAGAGIKVEDVVHRVGNLTLLTGKKNSAASNREFQYKRTEVYAKSSLPLTLDLVNGHTRDDGNQLVSNGPRPVLESFGLVEIANRQEFLASIADKVWSID